MDYNSFLKRDYKSLCTEQSGWRFRCTRLHVLVILACAVLLGTILTFASYEAEAKRNPTLDAASPDTPLLQDQRVTLPLSVPSLPASSADIPASGPAVVAPITAEPPQHWETVTVKRGDTLAAIFNRHHLPPGDLHQIMSLGAATATLKVLLPGQRFRLRQSDDQQLQELVYDINKTDSLHVVRDGSSFQAHAVQRTPEARIKLASATIDSSLFLAGQKAGLSENLIMELANIFAWDVDFALDIRSGDHFTVLYQEDFLDGEKLRDGDILAAEFTNQGKTYRAVRYTDASGHSDYYTPDGHSMRKAFLRTPVAFTHISSRFGMRYHPILNRMREHNGVDYAAPTGTPIKAAGDGKIVFRGVKGGYGNVIIIQHGGRYSTLYGHMSRFAKGIYTGKLVRQGQIIGYVGMTGLATGPHLHYEFRVNGVHRNPLTVKLPNAAPIAAQYKSDFEAHTTQLLTQLDVYARTQVAANQQ